MTLTSAPCPVFLSFFGIASIGLSCLVALFLYHVVFGIQYLGILNGVAAFVIVGIGELSPSHSRGPLIAEGVLGDGESGGKTAKLWKRSA